MRLRTSSGKLSISPNSSFFILVDYDVGLAFKLGKEFADARFAFFKVDFLSHYVDLFADRYFIIYYVVKDAKFINTQFPCACIIARLMRKYFDSDRQPPSSNPLEYNKGFNTIWKKGRYTSCHPEWVLTHFSL